MNNDLDNKLCEKYPLIFADRHKPKTESVMFWGFECGDGWYNIIDAMCAIIQGHINFQNNKRRIYLEKNYEDIPDHVPQVVAVQVKEKFGSLRFYYDGGDDYINGVVNMAVIMSEKTCMECGSPGTMRTDGWWHVACEEHYDE